MKIIDDMGFPDYFLVVWDYIKFARDSSIPVGPGRGSAAGSLVAYALQITNIDPVEHGLLFERFLNPARKSMPDIDTDFCIDRRNEVIDYVTSRYGEDKVAQIITFGRLQPKAVLRDVGRVFFWAFVPSLRESISPGGEGIHALPVHISLPSGLKIAPPFSGGTFSHSSPPHTNF